MQSERSTRLRELAAEVGGCRRCPRLVAWREQVARERRAAFAEDEYWGRPVPGFGDPAARVLLLGLAPAAHGANRTGRMFTGDRSGDFLFAALWRAGFASQPHSRSRDDGLELRDAWITAAVRCAPPANRPSPEERERCLPWSVAELALLSDVRVLVCLGAFAWDAALRLTAARRVPTPCRATASALRPRRGAGGRAPPDRLLPPEPAEHVHGQADRADDRRSARARTSARRLSALASVATMRNAIAAMLAVAAGLVVVNMLGVAAAEAPATTPVRSVSVEGVATVPIGQYAKLAEATAVYRQGMAAAIADGQSKAEFLAGKTGSTLGSVQSIVEGGGSIGCRGTDEEAGDYASYQGEEPDFGSPANGVSSVRAVAPEVAAKSSKPTVKHRKKHSSAKKADTVTCTLSAQVTLVYAID